jgi:hypothetical protein
LETSGPLEYLCQLLDSHGRAVWRSKFAALRDDDALAVARNYLRDRIDSACVFELWQDRRYIGCENDAIVLELGAVEATRRLSP